MSGKKTSSIIKAYKFFLKIDFILIYKLTICLENCIITDSRYKTNSVGLMFCKL
jgi:hypothetical protein